MFKVTVFLFESILGCDSKLNFQQLLHDPAEIKRCHVVNVYVFLLFPAVTIMSEGPLPSTSSTCIAHGKKSSWPGLYEIKLFTNTCYSPSAQTAFTPRKSMIIHDSDLLSKET